MEFRSYCKMIIKRARASRLSHYECYHYAIDESTGKVKSEWTKNKL